MAYGAIRLAALTLITVSLAGCIHVFPNKNIEPVFQDRGGEFTGNPYNHLEAPEYSKGRIAGFRELFVEADPFAEELKPAIAPVAPVAPALPTLPSDMTPVLVVRVDLSTLDEGHSWDDMVAAFSKDRATAVAVMPSTGLLMLKAPADTKQHAALIKQVQNIKIAGKPLARYSTSVEISNELPTAAAAGMVLESAGSTVLTVVPKPPPQPDTTPSKGTLPVNNISTSYAEVSINGAKVGIIPPLARARLHDVKAGTYEVDFLLPNGFKWTEKIETSTTL